MTARPAGAEGVYGSVGSPGRKERPNDKGKISLVSRLTPTPPPRGRGGGTVVRSTRRGVVVASSSPEFAISRRTDPGRQGRGSAGHVRLADDPEAVAAALGVAALAEALGVARLWRAEQVSTSDV